MWSWIAESLDPEDSLQDPGSGVRDHLVLDLVDAIVQFFDRGQRLIDGQLEKANQQMVRAVAQPVARVALDVDPVLIEDRERTGVVGDDIIAAEEDIKLLKVQDVGAAGRFGTT